MIFVDVYLESVQLFIEGENVFCKGFTQNEAFEA
jgi:hypothetical protein